MTSQTRLIEIEYEKYIEEDMSESQSQINLNDYLKSLLKHLYALQGWFVTGNLAIYPPTNDYPFTNLAPDMAVFKGVVLSPQEQAELTSWQMKEPNRPAPSVVFEVSSEATWKVDLDLKPEYYRLLGVKEYFAYDPQQLWRGVNSRLLGWRYKDGKPEQIQPDPDHFGELWSEELDSWLKADGPYLRLYDRQGQLRLTVEEASDQRATESDHKAAEIAQQAEAARKAAQADRKAATDARKAAQADRKAAADARKAEEDARKTTEAARKTVEAYREAAEAAGKATETAREAAEAALRDRNAILEKLRKNNIDLDSL